MSENKDKGKKSKAEECCSDHGHEHSHDHHHHGEEVCLFCMLKAALAGKRSKHAEFFKHVDGAQREVLMAVRALIDDRLGDLAEKPEKKATKIKVK